MRLPAVCYRMADVGKMPGLSDSPLPPTHMPLVNLPTASQTRVFVTRGSAIAPRLVHRLPHIKKKNKGDEFFPSGARRYGGGGGSWHMAAVLARAVGTEPSNWKTWVGAKTQQVHSASRNKWT